MRILLIDVGNTNLKWAWLEEGRLSPSERIGHRAEGITAQAYHCWSHAERPERVLVANVAGRQAEAELRQWIGDEWGIEMETACACRRQLGVQNGYAVPEQLGADRWLALIAARHHCDGPVCIVDCGTAITIDLLRQDGQHQGGLILPGLAMMRQAILERTQIPAQDVPAHPALLAQDTAGAIAAGGVHAAAALVERVARKIGPLPEIILTGSDAEKLEKVMELEAKIDPELVLRGLARVAQAE